MGLTIEQVDYIKKQYGQFLDGKISAEKCSDRLQKYFHTNTDVRKVLQECKEYNKGYSDITFLDGN